MVEQYEYYDEDFDNALESMLAEARKNGDDSRRITAKELHATVVTSRKMYMRWHATRCGSCGGSRGHTKSRVVFTPASNQGSKLEIEYSADDTD